MRALAVLVVALPAFAQAPVRLNDALPAWLRVSVDVRARFEHLEQDFRANAPASENAFALRTNVPVELRFKPLAVGVELMDARFYATDGTPLNNGLANPLDVLQAYATLRGESLTVSVGRLTLDVGSRRLVARNDYRNTINAFTGLDARWTHAGHQVRAFAVLPVQRNPSAQADLVRNSVQPDLENPNALLWGLWAQSAPLGGRVQLEGYVFGLHEGDGPVATANRQLVTPGLRVLRAPKPGELDFQLEAMLQAGTSRSSVLEVDRKDLAHAASSLHATVGWQFALPFQPRLAGFYDFASGDDDANDGKNGRFDPLFGARRFDFGPTGLFGPLARANLSSPGLKLEVTPHERVDGFVSVRAVWLASARDAWTTASLRDATGASGRFVGDLLEARARWHVFPKNLVLDVGGALLLRGEFARKVGGRDEPAAYFYGQLTGSL